MGPKQFLQLQIRMGLGVMAMKVYSTIPKIFRTGASPSNIVVSYPGYDTLRGDLPLCRDAVSIFYSTHIPVDLAGIKR